MSNAEIEKAARALGSYGTTAKKAAEGIKRMAECMPKWCYDIAEHELAIREINKTSFLSLSKNDKKVFHYYCLQIAFMTDKYPSEVSNDIHDRLSGLFSPLKHKRARKVVQQTYEWVRTGYEYGDSRNTSFEMLRDGML